MSDDWFEDLREQQEASAKRVEQPHELLPFLAVHAARYQAEMGLNGLHPHHYDLMKKYGARMDSFQRATNASYEQGTAG